MKKHSILRHVSLLLLAALLVGALASCGLVVDILPVGQKASTVLSLANKNADKANAYTAHTTVEYKEADDIMTVTGETTVKITGAKKGDFRTETAVTSHVVMESAHVDETVTVTEGFQNGYMYLKTDESAMCYPISAKDYRDFQDREERQTPADDLLSIDISDKDAAEITCEKSDKKYTVTVSELTGEVLDDLVAVLQINSMLTEGRTVESATLSFTVNSDFEYERMDMSFLIKDADEKQSPPALTVSSVMSGWNDTVIEDLDFAKDYKEQEADMRILDKVSDLYDMMDKAKSGSFTIEADTKFSYYMQTQTSSETDQVTFSDGEDGFTYDIKANINKEQYEITYRNGKQRVYAVKNPTNTDITPCTDAEARDYLASLYNSISYNKYNVTKVSYRANGSYNITLSDKGELENIKDSLVSQGYTVTNASANLAVIVDDSQSESDIGNISMIKCYIKLELRYKGTDYTMSITNTMTVGELVMDGETAEGETGSESN